MMFDELVDKIKCSSIDEKKIIVIEAVREMGKDAILSGMMTELVMIGAKLGIAGRTLSELDKQFIDYVFSTIGSGTDEGLYKIITGPLQSGDLDVLSIMKKLGKKTPIPFIKYVLCFAYVDGIPDKEVYERLKQLM